MHDTDQEKQQMKFKINRKEEQRPEQKQRLKMMQNMI